MIKTPIELISGKVEGYDSKNRVYKVSTIDGRQIEGCRKVGDAVNNTGGRKIQEIEKDTEVLLAMQFMDSSFQYVEAFIVGAFETRNGSVMGTTKKRDPYLEGTQGFAQPGNRRMLIHPDGRIELRANPWCSVLMDPKDNSIKQFFQRLSLTKDPSNSIDWYFHPDSEDQADALLHVGITGQDSLLMDYPDIEFLAGSLWGLSEQDFMKAMSHYGFAVDPGAVLAMRLSKQHEAHGEEAADTHTFLQFGDLTTGEILDLLVERRESMQARVKLGEFGEERTQTGLIQLGDGENDVIIETFKDGRYKISNTNSHIEVSGDGTIDAVAAGGSAAVHLDKNGEAIVTSPSIKIGSANAEEPMVLGAVLAEVLGKMITMITDHDHGTPSGPSLPANSGQLSVPLFEANTPDLDTIKSVNHTVE